MSALDTLADRAQQASRRLAGQGGIRSKLAEELAEDAAFLRKIRPSLVAMRTEGDASVDGRPRPQRERSGPNPFVVVGVALVAGVALAKWIDWRGHAHPRR